MTLLVVTAIAVAFCGLLLSFASGSAMESRTMRVWGGSLLIGALGLVVSAAGHLDRSGLADGGGTMLFLAATGMAWTGARLFADRPVAAWWPMAPPSVWAIGAVLLPWDDGRLALACFIGAGFTTLAAGEVWRCRTEQLASLPAVCLLLTAHAVLYLARGSLAVVGRAWIPGWAPVLLDIMVLESLLHAMGIAFLFVAMMKERVELRNRKELRALALSDGLTGIANRRHFDMKLSIEGIRMAESCQPLALVLIDIDHFKRLNDLLGHPEGDRCLCAVAAAISDVMVQPGGLAARYGGEEFALLMPGTALPATVRLAEAARLAVERLGLPHPAGGTVSVSIGAASISALPGRPADVEALVTAADSALYAAKAAGRNRVCTWADVPTVPGAPRSGGTVAA